ncbi:MAG: MerR family transcriptional regulator [Thermodesulfobacteriota bacterium]|nr:MAG: MerR family transcriptional regulator [Thermodesulfobacteriota bacterium]
MTQIPEKLYFKIGEVASITKVKPYVLRYWESEFRIISPKKSLTKQRVYSRRDIELILDIKRLLYKEGFTLEGAKKKVKEIQAERAKQLDLGFSEKKVHGALKAIQKELASIRKMLA